MANANVNKVVLGSSTLIDLTSDTITAENVIEGYTFHAADGSTATGSLTHLTNAEIDEITGGSGGSSVTVEALSVTANGTYTAPSGTSYSPVTVNVPAPVTMNVQTYQDYDYVSSTSYIATDVTLTVEVSGTYDVSWMGWRNTTSGTSGSRMYVNGSSHGTAHTTFVGSYGQFNTETGVSLNAGDVVVIRARSRSTSYRMYVGGLILQQTA